MRLDEGEGITVEEEQLARWGGPIYSTQGDEGEKKRTMRKVLIMSLLGVMLVKVLWSRVKMLKLKMTMRLLT